MRLTVSRQWILPPTSQATYSGTYTLTAADGSHDEVYNVKITTPVSTSHNPNAAVKYRIIEGAITDVRAALGILPAAAADLTKLTDAQLREVSQKLGLIK